MLRLGGQDHRLTKDGEHRQVVPGYEHAQVWYQDKAFHDEGNDTCGKRGLK